MLIFCLLCSILIHSTLILTNKQKEIIGHLTAQLEEKVQLLNHKLVESSHREYPEFNKGLEIIELEKAVEHFKKVIEEVKKNPYKALDYYAK
jgi:hypothetical protein